jgi:hypothetical protein
LAQPGGALNGGFVFLYHLKFSEARRVFLDWQHDHPSDPMGFVSEAASHLFEEFEHHGVLTADFFLDDDRLLGGIKGQADPARTKAFELANERAQVLGEGELKRNRREPNALLTMTLVSGMRADYASLITKHQVESLRQIRTAEQFGQRLLAVDSRAADAYMALGAANYILACLPSYKRAVLWFGGMQGNKQRGMDQLMRAANGGHYLAPYAKVMLGLASLREHRDSEAIRLLRELTAQFPESALFSRELANVERIASARR